MSEGCLLLQEKLVQHAGPTILDIKTGSLFCLKKDSCQASSCIYYFNDHLKAYGMKITILKETKSSYLVYVYNMKSLEHLINDKEIKAFLVSLSYEVKDVKTILSQLRLRFRKGFPHEIGIFLGYPLHDVIHFMHGEKTDYVGYWKVYSHIPQAFETFHKYDCLKHTLLKRVHNGEIIFNMMEACRGRSPS